MGKKKHQRNFRSTEEDYVLWKDVLHTEQTK